MKSIKVCLFVLCLINLFIPAVRAENGWLARARLNVVATGTIESYLPPELHRLTSGRNSLDLNLVGPDGNDRALELFWRESSDESTISLKDDKMEWQDNNQLVWQGAVPDNFLINSLRIELPDCPDAVKLSCEGMTNGKWEIIASNVAVMQKLPYGKNGIAVVEFAEKSYSGVRISFVGFDKNFRPTPIKELAVNATGRRGGAGFKTVVRALEFKEVPTEDLLEVQIKLPGSGIFIQNLEIMTQAMFKGKWSVNREKIVLGQRQLVGEIAGEIDVVGKEPEKLKIGLNHIWHDRNIVVTLKSEDYFGKIVAVNAEMRLPRIVFVADIVGNYFLETGKNKEQRILEYAGELNRKADHFFDFSGFEHNSVREEENFLKDYSIKGGPFRIDGYTWKAPVEIEKPGFYCLRLSSAVALENRPESLRIVKNGFLIPYFVGRSEERELPLKYEHEYDFAANRTIYQVRLPAGRVLPRYIKFKTSGVFDRKITIQYHIPGMVGWQTWKNLAWVNPKNRDVSMPIDLNGFPNDQKEIRVIIDNGSNQSLKIDEVVAVYSARDLFFVATEAGEYSLYGGNSSAGPAQYDLALIQHKLLAQVPQEVTHGNLIEIAADSQNTNGSPQKGGPFESAGYTWVASFSAPASGLCQLALNQKASLDNYRGALRIVKDGNQVPYFAGKIYTRKVKLPVSENYDRSENKTVLEFSLPVASKFWDSVEFNSPGIFNRSPLVMLRKPGKLGWKVWQKLNWIGNNPRNNTFSLNLKGLPEGETDFRIEISHGDNSPIVVSSINAVYRTQDLFFNAAGKGEYFVYGGNPTAKAPAYDISMIRDQLLKSEPQKLTMGETVSYSEIAVKKQIEEVFSEKGWGLYLVLGLVTLILLVVIVKIFPEEESGKAAEENAKTEDTKVKKKETLNQ
ncbi:MAG: hypothetical protein Kow0029_15970 [Candidatus Rifleibacteriota bacterium]